MLVGLNAAAQKITPKDAKSGIEAPDFGEVYGNLNLEIETNFSAYQQLKIITEQIGPRLTGTARAKQAENYVANLFTKLGFTGVQREEFEFVGWQRDSVTLEVVPRNSDNYVKLRTIAFAYTPLQAQAEGALADAGSGLPEDYRATKVTFKNKILLINLGLMSKDSANGSNIPKWQKVALAMQAGAKGVIFIAQAPGSNLQTGTVSNNANLVSIPALCISANDGAELRKWLADEKLIANVNVYNHTQKLSANNIIAEIPGEGSLAKEKIVISAHLDSYDLGRGAIYNGYGVATVLELARAFKNLDIKPKRTIQFVLFMGAKQGLIGSNNYVNLRKSQRKLQQIKYMVNVDAAIGSTGFEIHGRKEAVTFFQMLSEDIRVIDSSFGGKDGSATTPALRPRLLADHQPFLLEGIPVASLNSNPSKAEIDCYQADCDMIDKVSEDAMLQTTRAAALMVYALANCSTLPAKLLSEPALKDWLVQNGLREELQQLGQWKYRAPTPTIVKLKD